MRHLTPDERGLPIEERLRDMALPADDPDARLDDALMREAADEITRLRGEVRRLEEERNVWEKRHNAAYDEGEELAMKLAASEERGEWGSHPRTTELRKRIANAEDRADRAEAERDALRDALLGMVDHQPTCRRCTHEEAAEAALALSSFPASEGEKG